jgi:glucose-6-phosphate isomerase, archaeal
MSGKFPAFTTFDPLTGLIALGGPEAIDGAPLLERRLSDLRGYFVDEQAYAAALAMGDPLLYTAANVEPAEGAGALHYGITRLLPGRIGDEYYLTKGHYHAWRPAAEYYIGLSGEGILLLEDERSGDCWSLPLTPHSAAYVPGYAAHRTVNIGNKPLIFLGIYPAGAGHDYGAIAKRNFRHVVVAVEGEPKVIERARYHDLFRL